MKTYKYIIIILFFYLFLTSCEKDAEIDLPEVDPELVVSSFISAEKDSIQLKLLWTSPIYNNSNNKNKSEPNADVAIYKNGNKYLLQYDANSETYYKAINTDIGDDFSLKINYKDKVLESKCRIVEEPKYTIEYLGSRNKDNDGYSGLIHEIKIVCNNTQETNYYRLNFAFKYLGYYQQAYTTNEFYTISNGESKTISIQGDYNENADSLIVIVINSDEHYYRYHTTVKNYSGGGDFFTEPGIIYNNIENGIGIFSSYYRKTSSIKIN